MNSQNTKTNRARRVVVIGGSMAGLLSAKVLSKHFDRVTVIERDSFPDSAEPRTGTPQAHHVHVLLARGMRSLEAFFPGLRADMLAEGALEIEGGSDIAWLNPAGWGITFTSSVKALSFSRSLLDWVVRRHLSAIPNIEFLENREVTELLINESGDCLTGVAFRNRSGDAQDEEWRASDLIVDAVHRRRLSVLECRRRRTKSAQPIHASLRGSDSATDHLSPWRSAVLSGSSGNAETTAGFICAGHRHSRSGKSVTQSVSLGAGSPGSGNRPELQNGHDFDET